MNSERMRCDSTMQHHARQETKLELMVLYEYTTPKCFQNTLTIRLSRPLIRTDTSLDRVQSIPIPAVVTRGDDAYHCIRCQLSRHSTNPASRTELSTGLHGSCHVSTRLVGLHECDQIPSSQVPNTFHTTRVQRQTKTVLA